MFPASSTAGKSQIYDCAHSEIAGYRCGFTHADAALPTLTADLRTLARPVLRRVRPRFIAAPPPTRASSRWRARTAPRLHHRVHALTRSPPPGATPCVRRRRSRAAARWRRTRRRAERPASLGDHSLDQPRSRFGHRAGEGGVERFGGLAADRRDAEALGETDPVDAADRRGSSRLRGGRARRAGAGAAELDAEDAVGVVGEDDDGDVEASRAPASTGPAPCTSPRRRRSARPPCGPARPPPRRPPPGCPGRWRRRSGPASRAAARCGWR